MPILDPNGNPIHDSEPPPNLPPGRRLPDAVDALISKARLDNGEKLIKAFNDTLDGFDIPGHIEGLHNIFLGNAVPDHTTPAGQMVMKNMARTVIICLAMRRMDRIDNGEEKPPIDLRELEQADEAASEQPQGEGRLIEMPRPEQDGAPAPQPESNP